MADPHQDLHDIAAADSEPHAPVAVAGEDWQTALDKVNKALTKRINDLRTDNDTFQRAVSASVAAIQADVKSLRTAAGNNKASIDAQDALIEQAAAKADAAKQAADAGASKINDVSGTLTALGQSHAQLERAYGAHTHDLTVALQGQTTGPKAGNQ